MNFKNIYIGELIKKRVDELNFPLDRICNFLKCTEDDLEQIYSSQQIGTDILLKISKLLQYDFFRIYTQHLILFAPQGNTDYNQKTEVLKSELPAFRKNIYTKEIIFFILELLETKEKTPAQIIKEYKIPKATLYKWIQKYNTK